MHAAVRRNQIIICELRDDVQIMYGSVQYSITEDLCMSHMSAKVVSKLLSRVSKRYSGFTWISLWMPKKLLKILCKFLIRYHEAFGKLWCRFSAWSMWWIHATHVPSKPCCTERKWATMLKLNVYAWQSSKSICAKQLFLVWFSFVTIATVWMLID